MKLTLLGTGTPAPSTKRQSSGYLVEIGDETIVLDHGPGAHHRLIEGGFRSTDVTHALFTHLHYDHCMDYAAPGAAALGHRRRQGRRSSGLRAAAAASA